MGGNINSIKSHWWTQLSEFGEEVLLQRRKKYYVTQSQVASITGLNQSEISRLERGLTTPRDLPTLNAISDAYRLTGDEKQKYIELIFGSKQFNQESKLLFDFLSKQINSMADLNRSGNSLAAAQQLELTKDWLKLNWISLPNKEELVKILSYALLEESAAWWDIINPEDLKLKVEPLLNEGAILAKNRPDTADYYKLNKGFNFYIKNDYKNAKKILYSINEDNINLGKHWRSELARVKIITAGRLGEIEEVKKNEKRILSLIENNEIGNIEKAYLLEGVARAYSSLNHSDSIKIIEKAYRIISAIENSPNFWKVRSVQISRTFLEIAHKDKQLFNQLRNLANKAITWCDKYNFTRHKKQIISILKS